LKEEFTTKGHEKTRKEEEEESTNYTNIYDDKPTRKDHTENKNKNFVSFRAFSW